jgi:hypothetical protein
VPFRRLGPARGAGEHGSRLGHLRSLGLEPVGFAPRAAAALHGQARVIARALQVYGALVADNSGGSKVFISGTPDPGWDDDDLDQLKSIPASALEAVVTGPVHPG